MLVLTNIAIILLLGMLCSLLARKLGLSDVLVLLIFGLILGKLNFNGALLFIFDNSFLVAVGVLALIMVAFDSFSRLRLKEASFPQPVFRMMGLFALFSVLLITLFTNALFFKQLSLMNILFAAIFALVVVGTDTDAAAVMLKDHIGEKAKRVLALLQSEALLSTALVVVLPFIVIDIIRTVAMGSNSLNSQLSALLLQIIVGIGSGVVIGLIVLRTMQKFYLHHLASISLIVSALLAYLLAENLKGNGALAVAALGFLFGSFYVREKPKLQEFSSMLSGALEIMVFVFLGMIIKIPLTLTFIMGSLLIFLLLVLCRLAAVFASLRNSAHSLKEKFFISLNMPKGITVAVIVFALALFQDAQLDIVLSLIFAIMIYSLVLSSVVNNFSRSFVKSK